MNHEDNTSKLTAASLVCADGRPLIPELFWALAEEWHPHPVALREVPPRGGGFTYAALGVNQDECATGWAVAGTVGAAAWGAPTVTGVAYPLDFYVPTANAMRQATLRLGEPSRFEHRAATAAVAPTPLVCAERYERTRNEWGHWLYAHGLFAALDLARDRSRGAEILAGWDPKDFSRVW